MRKTIVGILVALFVCGICAAQEAEAVSPVPGLDVTLPNLIIHKPALINTVTYEFLDGNRIRNSEMKKVLLTVPENRTLVAKYDAWKITSWILLGIGCASLGTAIAADIPGIDPAAASYMTRIGYSVGAVTVPFACLTAMFGNSRMSTAVDNYNVSLIKEMAD